MQLSSHHGLDNDYMMIISVEYVPGNQLGTAGTFSQCPLATQHNNESSNVIDTKDYVNAIVVVPPFTDMILSIVRSALSSDEVQRINVYLASTWPNDVTSFSAELLFYWHSLDQYAMHDGLLLHNVHIAVTS